MLERTSLLGYKAHDAALAALCFLFAALLTYVGIDRKGLWLDEALSLNVTSSWADFPLRLQELRGASWLYYLLLFGWHSFAESDTALRISSLLAGAVATALTYLIGRRLAGPWGGTLSALILASNWMFISHSQELRMYALATALVCANGLILLRAIRVRTTGPWLLCGLLSVLCMATHYFALLAWAAQFAAALVVWRRDVNWRGASLAVATALAAVLIHWVLFQPSAIATSNFLSVPSIKELGWTLEKFSGTNRPQAVLFACAGVVAIGLSLLVARRSGTLGDRLREVAWLASWLILPIFGLYVLSIVGRPVFLVRYLVPAIPALALLVGCALARIRSPWLLAGLVSLVVVSQIASYREFRNLDQKEDWRAAAAHYKANAMAGDTVVFFSYYVEAPFRRYAGLSWASGRSTPAIQPDNERLYLWSNEDGATLPFDDAIVALSGRNRVWLVLSHDLLAFNPQQNRARQRLFELLAQLDLRAQQEWQVSGVRLLLLVKPPETTSTNGGAAQEAGRPLATGR